MHSVDDGSQRDWQKQQKTTKQAHCSNNISLGVSLGEDQPSLVMAMFGVEIRECHSDAVQPHFSDVIVHVYHHSNPYRERRALHRAAVQQEKQNSKWKNGYHGSLQLQLFELSKFGC
ncbi:hypothetical protein AAHA92_13361 [Salvia divinorum]|uniref:Uncharacterized protein n=1 Tax=Salvia divinorum TaxID=28513 RepID=A0ABD1H824_SALDI